MKTPITKADIEAAKTPAGGWTAATLRTWGVPWPPPKGWRRVILEHGIPYDESLNEPENRRGDPDQVLRKVLLAVIEAGRADILYDIPEALDFMGSRIPSEDEIKDHHTR